MDITKAQFWNTPNVAGRESFSYADLLAQLTIDITSGGGNPFIGDGAEVRASSGQNVGTVIGALTFNVEVYDDLAFADLGVDNDRLIIPVTNPQITRVQLACFTRWNNTQGGQTGVRQVNISKNGSSGVGGDGISVRRENPLSVGSFDNLYAYNSLPQEVVPGDFFQLLALQNSTVGTLSILNCNLAIVVLK